MHHRFTIKTIAENALFTGAYACFYQNFNHLASMQAGAGPATSLSLFPLLKGIS
ncbi:hypothetical protein [Polaromonas sp.]|uniref:hypothetical protein n=1 Tax=Polaromonas sp. TaxID=1869339 RepID=UPI0013BE4B2A|nr:hypothetical protein [Polaromonas sp.]NDP64470.1 hypothetical protein [Polaromonas sp.]